METENSVHDYVNDNGERVSPLEQAEHDLELFETGLESIESFEAWIGEH